LEDWKETKETKETHILYPFFTKDFRRLPRDYLRVLTSFPSRLKKRENTEEREGGGRQVQRTRARMEYNIPECSILNLPEEILVEIFVLALSEGLLKDDGCCSYNHYIWCAVSNVCLL